MTEPMPYIIRQCKTGAYAYHAPTLEHAHLICDRLYLAHGTYYYFEKVTQKA